MRRQCTAGFEEKKMYFCLLIVTPTHLQLLIHLALLHSCPSALLSFRTLSLRLSCSIWLIEPVDTHPTEKQKSHHLSNHTQPRSSLVGHQAGTPNAPENSTAARGRVFQEAPLLADGVKREAQRLIGWFCRGHVQEHGYCRSEGDD